MKSFKHYKGTLLALLLAPVCSMAEDTLPMPDELVASTPKGELVNPYDPTDPATAEEGHQLYMDSGCNGCHGGTGGGGMCPPLTNQRWVYGDDFDTLFRLVTLGSGELQNQGYSRIAMEKVKGLMPPQHSGPIKIFESSEDLWKILTWVKSLHLEK